MAGIFLDHFASPRVGEVAGIIGWSCLQLFLALSGFLTTMVLLRDRELSNPTLAGRWRAALNFYARRSLRIFPIYYLVITSALVFDVWPARQTFAWLATYTANLYICFTGRWNALGDFAHLWSMSVQEQFYVVWGAVVLLAPRRWLAPVSGLMVAAGPIYRLTAALAGLHPAAISFFTLACMDALGLGALMALAQPHRSSRSPSEADRRRFMLFLVVLIAALGLFVQTADGKMEIVGFNLIAGIVACGIIEGAIRGFPQPLGRWLESAPLVFLGRISYGLFVYHLFMPKLLKPIIDALPIEWADGGFRALLVYSLATIAVAALSWHWIEQPINLWKARFRSTPSS